MTSETQLGKPDQDAEAGQDEDLSVAMETLRKAANEFSPDVLQALETVIAAASETKKRDDGDIEEELRRRNLEMTTGVSGTQEGKLAVDFLANLPTERIARLIDEGTITQSQVAIFAELARRQAQAFA